MTTATKTHDTFNTHVIDLYTGVKKEQAHSLKPYATVTDLNLI